VSAHAHQVLRSEKHQPKLTVNAMEMVKLQHAEDDQY